MNTMKCPLFGYEWVPRRPAPKECPNCKARFVKCVKAGAE